jgi:hypothetical protein
MMVEKLKSRRWKFQTATYHLAAQITKEPDSFQRYDDEVKPARPSETDWPPDSLRQAKSLVDF